MKYIFVFNLVVFNLKHTKYKKRCVFACVCWGGDARNPPGSQGGATLSAWKSLGITGLKLVAHDNPLIDLCSEFKPKQVYLSISNLRDAPIRRVRVTKMPWCNDG